MADSTALRLSYMESSIGPITILASSKGVRQIVFSEPDLILQSILKDAPSTIVGPDSCGAVMQLKEYFEGRRRQFDLDLDLQGTRFQKRVWKALLSIPYGEIRSYKDIAQEIGCPRGYRAVGQANGANPIPIIIPCHRVLAANGGLGGFSSGLEIKRALLKLEGTLPV